jgi:hypothetical protein
MSERPWRESLGDALANDGFRGSYIGPNLEKFLDRVYALERELAEARKFRASIEAAWRWASETTRPGATYIFGNKLRRAIREALEATREVRS